MPDMIFVDSSIVESVGYDEATQELHVQFLSSGYYIYQGVPDHIFQGLVGAPSVGSFLNREVKGAFPYIKQ